MLLEADMNLRATVGSAADQIGKLIFFLASAGWSDFTPFETNPTARKKNNK